MLDVAVVGGGPAGAALAALAAGTGLAVEVFEARLAPSGDRRTLALSESSRALLDEAGAWPTALATPITEIHVSQRGAPGRALLHARDHGLAALGYTVPFAGLESALHARLQAARIPLRMGAACEDIALAPDAARLHLVGGEQVEARLLVLADGGTSAARIPGLAFHEKDYGQRAVVASVRTDRPHEGRAYERFTNEGPMALLPVDDRYALVWTAEPEAAEGLLDLEDAMFLARLQQRFGDRAGRFLQVAQRAAFPLRLRLVNTPIAARTAIIGNAAQAMHPVAGQGLNIGLRDARELARLLGATPRRDLGSPAMLARYRAARASDARRGVAFTDFIAEAFGGARPVPAWARGAALGLLDVVAPARRAFGRRMIFGAGR